LRRNYLQWGSFKKKKKAEREREKRGKEGREERKEERGKGEGVQLNW